MKKNTIAEPDNDQGQFEKALHRLQEKLTDFHCPICHAQQGITFFDDPYFVMHYNWIRHEDKPWHIDTAGSCYGKSSVLGVCNNCGYEMMFNVSFVAPEYKELTFMKESVHIKRQIEIIERRKRTKKTPEEKPEQ